MITLSSSPRNQLATCLNQVERIYVTRGDNTYDDAGVKCDKFMGVTINGEIHWVDHSFAYLHELEHQLSALNVEFCFSAKRWGIRDEKGSAYLSNTITTVKPHHDDMFAKDSFYMKRTKEQPNGKRFWKLSDLIDTYFNIEATEQAIA